MEREVIVGHREGLHARPAALFVQTAGGFESSIEVVAGGKTANARSILSILKLGVQCGQTVLLRATGSDAESAVGALAALLEKSA